MSPLGAAAGGGGIAVSGCCRWRRRRRRSRGRAVVVVGQPHRSFAGRRHRAAVRVSALSDHALSPHLFLIICSLTTNTSRRLRGDKTFNPFVRLDGCGRTVAGAVEKGTCHFTWEGATRADFGRRMHTRRIMYGKGRRRRCGRLLVENIKAATEWNEARVSELACFCSQSMCRGKVF